MTSATNHDPDTTPDRASFTTALNTARDQVIHAAGVIAGTVIDLVGSIGRAVLNDLLPARRNRISPRVVKRAISKHRAKGHTDRTNHRAARLVARRRERDPLGELIDRERAVLAAMAQGLSNVAVAGELHLAVKTVEAHVTSIFTKLGLIPDDREHRRVRAVLTFLRGGPGPDAQPSRSSR
jgi:ATP/maltotriose-dependent transcriptional regulator MalT